MKTSEQREKHFREELRQLLSRHGAVMVATDDGKPYAAVCKIQMDAVYDDADSGDLLADFCEFEI